MTKAKDPLVNCPRGCGFMVLQSKVGNPHSITVKDPKTNEMSMKTCK